MDMLGEPASLEPTKSGSSGFEKTEPMATSDSSSSSHSSIISTSSSSEPSEETQSMPRDDGSRRMAVTVPIHDTGSETSVTRLLNTHAVVCLPGNILMVDVSRLYFDDCTSQGNCFNKYLGLKDVKYWHARRILGTGTGYNSLEPPLGIIPPTSPFRRRLVHLVDSVWFTRPVLFVILANAVCLAIDASTRGKGDHNIRDFLQISEYVFLAVFTIEAMLKISAMGFCMHIDSYFVEGVREGHKMVKAPNWWNIIDFIIVILAWVGLFPTVANFTVIRSLRLLRPLKALHSVEGLQILLKALLSSMGPLSNVVVLLLFFMIMFAITGVLIWEGTWHQRCYLDVTDIVQYGSEDLLQSAMGVEAAVWNASGSAPTALPSSGNRSLTGWVIGDWVLQNVTTACTTGKFGRHCNMNDIGVDVQSSCDARDWKRYKYLNFDNTLTALLLVFKIISLDNWPDDMMVSTDAVGQFTFIYFLALTLFGSFFTMNLVLAVLCSNFATISDEIRDEKLQEKVNEGLQVYRYTVSISTIHFNYMRMAIAVYGAGMQLPNANRATRLVQMASVFDAIRDCQERSLVMHGESGLIRKHAIIPPQPFTTPTYDRRLSLSPRDSGVRKPSLRSLASSRSSPQLVPTPASPRRTPAHGGDDVVQSYREHTMPREAKSPSDNMADSHEFLTREVLSDLLKSDGCSLRTDSPTGLGTPQKQIEEHANELNGADQPDDDPDPFHDTHAGERALVCGSTESGAQDTGAQHQVDMNGNESVGSSYKARIDDHHEVHTEGTTESDDETIDEEDNDQVEETGIGTATSTCSESTNTGRPCWEQYNRSVKKLVLWKWFNRFIVFVITLNVLVMCMDYHGASGNYQRFLEITSLACNGVFIMEMILKNVGLSIKGYFSSSWNRFDCLLVLISIPEMVSDLLASQSGRGNAVTAFRALRAVRVTRLLRRNKSLQEVVATIMRSLQSAVYLCIIMLLFIFVFSVLGVQLFSDSLPSDERNNFKSLWHAAITVFVIITGEQWTTIMHEAMVATSPAAAIYFVTLFSLGNYIFMNLFIAILIDNFADMHLQEMKERREREAKQKLEREERKKRKKARQAYISERARNEMMKWDSSGLDDSFRYKVDRASSLKSNQSNEKPRSNSAASPSSPVVPKINLKKFSGRNSFPKAAGLNSHRSEPPTTRYNSVTSLNSAATKQRGLSSRGGSKVFNSFPVPDTVRSFRSIKREQPPNTARNREAPNTARTPPPIARHQLTHRGPKKGHVSVCDLDFVEVKKKKKVEEDRLEVLYKGRSLFLFSIDNPVRVRLTRIVRHRAFDYLIVVIIVLNTVILALEGPWTKSQPAGFRTFLDVSDIVFVVLFTVEALMKMIVYGFIGDGCPGSGEPPQEEPADEEELMSSKRTSQQLIRRDDSLVSLADESEADKSLMMEMIKKQNEEEEYEDLCPYIFNTWNRVDFFVCITAVLGIFIPFFALFRSLRTLRLIIRNRNIKVVVRALFHALPDIGSVLAITSFIFLVFSILGVQLFKGKMHYCTDPSVANITDCRGEFTAPACSHLLTAEDCQKGDLQYFCNWDSRCVTTFDGDIWGDPVQATQNRSWVNSRYNFDNVGESFLSLFQVSYTETWTDVLWLGVDAHSPQESVTHHKDSHPEHALFFIAFMVAGNFFALNLFVGLLIDRFTLLRKQLVGSAFLTFEQQQWVKSQKGLNRIALIPKPIKPPGKVRGFIFTVIYHPWFDKGITVAICANVLVMSLRHYNQPSSLASFEMWANIGFLALFTIEAMLKIIVKRKKYFRDSWDRFDFALVLLSFGGLGVGTASIQVFRVLRIARMFRLIKKAKQLSILFGTLYYALPSLLNIAMLLLVTYFNYAVLGVQIFGNVRQGSSLNKWMNFTNLGKAMITLYTISTTEKWNDIMEDTIRDQSGCQDEGDCGVIRIGSILYFCTFMVIGSLIALNLFITVVLENFSEQQTQDLAQDMLHEFKEAWLEYDPKGKGWLHIVDFLCIIRKLPPPIGLKRPESIPEMIRHLRFLSIPVTREGRLRYIDSLRSISKKLFGITEEDMPLLEKFTKSDDDEAFTVYHLFAAIRIQERWKRYVRIRQRKAMAVVTGALIVVMDTMVNGWDELEEEEWEESSVPETPDDEMLDHENGDTEDDPDFDSPLSSRNAPYGQEEGDEEVFCSEAGILSARKHTEPVLSRSEGESPRLRGGLSSPIPFDVDVSQTEGSDDEDDDDEGGIARSASTN